MTIFKISNNILFINNLFDFHNIQKDSNNYFLITHFLDLIINLFIKAYKFQRIIFFQFFLKMKFFQITQ